MLTAYEIVASLYQSERVQVHRALRRADGLPVVIKQLTAAGLTSVGRNTLSYEHSILCELALRNCDGVLQPVELAQAAGGMAMVSRDVGATSLRVLQATAPLSLKETLAVATRVAAALIPVHTAGIVHKDINPGNVVFNRQTGCVQLIDFGIAATIAREPHHWAMPHAIEGTLPYISPEQTGRMNRPIDYRSDFYSLGVTLYELLCGQLPFDASDISRFIHAVLASPATPVDQLGTDVPPGVAAVVMQLLHKIPEQRYQSARGLKHDLEMCTDSVHQNGTAPLFPLQQHDHSESFDIPDTLYGREKSIDALFAAYERAVHTSELVWVTGPSGIGKSSLVHELQRVGTERDGGWDAQFASGKHARLRRHVPFDALGQAIDQVVRRLLMEPDAELQREQRRMQEALGWVGQSLIDIVPALELLIGKQPAAHPLPAVAHENRLMYLLRRCLRALSVTRPLVVFIDDLQWADDATLKFLTTFHRDTGRGGGVLLIGAYRDNEIDVTHPLHRTVDSLAQSEAGGPLTLAVPPLRRRSIDSLLRDTTRAELKDVYALSSLLLEKTAGNPFFIRIFLQDLVQRQLLTYHPANHCWTWKLSDVVSSAVTENVADLLARKLHQLPADTHHLLSLAACQGVQFSLIDLCATGTMPREVVQQHLVVLLAQGLILPMARAYRYAASSDADIGYTFAHDRIQETALAMLAPAVTMQVHYALGLRLLSQPRQAEHVVFRIVEHLNAALPIITDPAVREQLLLLNQEAGAEATRATAHEMAAHYLRQAEALLPPAPWQTSYDTMRSVQLRLATCEYVLGHHEAANKRLHAALLAARTAHERAEVHCRRAECLTAMCQYDASAAAFMAALGELGLPPPKQLGWVAVIKARLGLQAALRRRKIEHLPHAPDTVDPSILGQLGLLDSMCLTAYFVSPMLYAWVVFTMGQLTVKHGNSPYSSFVFGSLAAMAAATGNPEEAARYAAAARVRLERDPKGPGRHRSLIAINVSIDYARLSAHELPQSLLQASMSALECGDVNMASNGSIVGIDSLVLRSLDEGIEALKTFERLSPVVHREARGWYRDCTQLCRCLRGETNGPHTLSDSHYDERVERAKVLAGAAGAARPAKFFFTKMIASLVHRRLDDALDAATCAYEHRVMNTSGDFLAFFYSFFAALTLTQHALVHRRRHVANRRLLRICRRKLRQVTRAEPNILGGLPQLIDAECAALTRSKRAPLLYEQATAALDRSGYASLAALAHECAAIYFDTQRIHTAGMAHVRLAYEAYRAWGATYKLAHLDQHARAAVATADLHTTHDDLLRSIDVPALMQVTQILTGEVVLDKLAAKIVQHTSALAGATRAVLLQRTGRSWAIQVDSVSSHHEIPTALLNYVARSNEPLLLTDAAEASEFARDTYVARYKPRSLLCAPLMHQGQLRGVLYLENTLAPGLFTAERLELVKMVAAQAAVALENAHLYAELETKVADRTVQLQKAHAKVLQLQRDAAETQMAGGFAHEMRNALAVPTYALGSLTYSNAAASLPKSLRAVAARLRQMTSSQATGLCDELTAHAETLEVSLECATQGLERAMELTEQILHYAEVGNLVPGVDDINLRDLFDDVTDEFAEAIETHGIELHIDAPSHVRLSANRDHIITIVRHLVANACDALKATGQQHPRLLRLASYGKNGRVTVSVADSGVGIPDTVQTTVFQPFFTTKGSDGAGLGLGLSRKIAQIYGGDITFTSQPGEGSVFRVGFPDDPEPDFVKDNRSDGLSVNANANASDLGI